MRAPGTVRNQTALQQLFGALHADANGACLHLKLISNNCKSAKPVLNCQASQVGYVSSS